MTGSLLHLFVHGYALGVAHGAYAVTVVAAFELLHLISTGACYRVAGAWGEDNTREILRAAGRRHVIHGWVDSLEVNGGDIDHVVATKHSWWTIDSKWHSGSANSALVARDAAAARRAAQRARSVLRSLGPVPDVRPVVVVWGSMQSEIPDGCVRVDGVVFIAGQSLKASLTSNPLADCHETPSLTRAEARS